MSTSGRSSEAPPELSSELDRLVHDALVHLHDPVYLQTHPLVRLVAIGDGRGGRQLGEALRGCLREAVEALRPDNAAEDFARRGYDVLRLRYVEAVEIPEVERQLGLSHRQCQREHQRALAAVVSILRERWGVPHSDGAVARGGEGPPASVPRAPRLPVPLTSFVGRERELVGVRALLAANRLLCLTGLGGSGKTRLALEVAAQILRDRPADYPDGIYFVELASLSEPGLVAQTVAVALGVRDESSRSAVDLLVAHLAPRRLLLVLDNCEHLLLSCAQLAEALLKSCPELHILATSRAALGIGGETRYRVPLLGAPPPERWPDAQAIAEYDAVRLFLDRARAVQPDFALSTTNAASIGRICWQLDGVPLAIELAAARVRMLSVEQIAARLDDRFRLLTDGSRTAQGRQQTLKSALDWSYDLLAVAEAVLFRRLAVFAGGFTLESAEGICAGEGIEADEVLDLLGQLVDKSFVVVDEVRGEARYRLLETVRQYAEARLAEAGESHSLRERHLAHFSGLAERLEPEIWSGVIDVASARDRIDSERDNILAAVVWGLTENPEAVWPLMNYAHDVSRLGGLGLQPVHWSEFPVGQAPSLEKSPRATLAAAGLMAGDDPTTAVAWTMRAARMAQVSGDHLALGLAQTSLGVIARYRGENELARRHFRDGLAHYQAADYRRGIAEAILNLGVLARSEGNVPLARAHFEELVGCFREIGDWRGVSKTLGALGHLSWIEGDYTRAWSLMQESLAVSQKVHRWHHVFVGLAPLLARSAGERARAWQLARQGLEMFRRGGLDPHIPALLRAEGILLIDDGAHAAGVSLASAAAALEAPPPSPFDDIDQRTVADPSLGRAKEALGEAVYESAWAEGQAMTLDEAVEYALAESSAHC